MDSCYHSIERVVADFAQNKDKVKTLGTGLAPFFSIYSGFLTWTDNWSLSLKVYKSFKAIWPKFNEAIRDYYLAELENTSNSLVAHRQCYDAIPILNEIDSLQHEGYHFSWSMYYSENLLGLCYKNIGKKDEALAQFTRAASNYPSEKKGEDEYCNLQKNRFDIAIDKSILSTARETGLELIELLKAKDDTQGQIDVNLALSRLEVSLRANLHEAIKLYENGIELILQSPNYTKDVRKKYLNDLFTIYNTFDIPKNQRKFTKYAETLDTGKQYRINGIVDDTFIDSLTNVIYEEENKPLVDVDRYVYAVSYVAQYWVNRYQERKGLEIVMHAIEKCKAQNVPNNKYAPLYNISGDIYAINLYDYKQALKEYAKALDFVQYHGQQNSSLYLTTLSKIALAYKNTGNLINAKIFIDKALDVLLKSPELKSLKTDYYELLENASWIYASLGKETESLKFCDDIIDDIPNTTSNQELINANKYMKTYLLLYFCRYDQAYNILKEIDPNYFDTVNSWSLPFEAKFFIGDSSCVVELVKEQARLCSNIKRLFENFSTLDLFNYWDTNAANLNTYFSEALYQ